MLASVTGPVRSDTVHGTMAVNSSSEKPVRATDSVSSSPSRGSSDDDDDMGVTTTTATAGIERDVEKKSIDVAPELPPPTGNIGGAPGHDARETGAAVFRTRSRGSSTRSRALSVVPRLHRRGLFAQLALVPEVNRPFDYSNKVKWTITIFVAIAAAAAPLGSAIFFRKYLLYSSSLRKLWTRILRDIG